MKVQRLHSCRAWMPWWGNIRWRRGDELRYLDRLTNCRPRTRPLHRIRKHAAPALAVVLLSGCFNASIGCPSAKSTVNYRGMGLIGSTSVACLSTADGDTAIVSGLDLAALVTMLTPLVTERLQQQQQGGTTP